MHQYTLWASYKAALQKRTWNYWLTGGKWTINGLSVQPSALGRALLSGCWWLFCTGELWWDDIWSAEWGKHRDTGASLAKAHLEEGDKGARHICEYTFRKSSLNTGQLGSHSAWTYSRPNQTQSRAPCSSWPCFQQGSWTRQSFFQPQLFCDSMKAVSSDIRLFQLLSGWYNPVSHAV